MSKNKIDESNIDRFYDVKLYRVDDEKREEESLNDIIDEIKKENYNSTSIVDQYIWPSPTNYEHYYSFGKLILFCLVDISSVEKILESGLDENEIMDVFGITKEEFIKPTQSVVRKAEKYIEGKQHDKRIAEKIEQNIHYGFAQKNLLVDKKYMNSVNQAINKTGSVSVSVPTCVITDDNYVGFHVSDLLIKLLEKANGNLEEAEKGIIVLEDFEYAFPKNDDDEFFDAFRTQKAIEPYLDGNKKVSVMYNNKKYDFDTKGLTFICTGNYDDSLLLFESGNAIETFDNDFSYYLGLINQKPISGKEYLWLIQNDYYSSKEKVKRI